MNKQIGKNMFDGMELPEQAKQEVWGNLESIISNTTVEKRVHKNRVWVRRLGKTAAAFLIMGVLFGTINGVSHGGLVEAISGLWQTDESSQKIVTEMTDYHVRLDSVYAPEIISATTGLMEMPPELPAFASIISFPLWATVISILVSGASFF